MPSEASREFLDHSYAQYSQIEEAFQAELDKSLDPRGSDFLLELVDRLALAPGSTALDVGCGEGRYSLELAGRFGLSVHGIDPVREHIDICNALARKQPELAHNLRFDVGEVEHLPEDDASTDLVWFRDALVHVAAIDTAFGEVHRVLRPNGHLLLYHQLATDRLEPREASWLFRTMGVVERNAEPSYVEAAYSAAGFALVEQVELRGEWIEHNLEQGGVYGRQLVHASRLLRAPERYIAQFGQRSYDVMFGDCLWHIYQLIGKLSPRIYLLRKP